MGICPACGHENTGWAKFCEECATPIAVGPTAREQRKTVTVLFCDVTDSTALGESTDPEALRALLARYFELMKGIVESHGGTVEKFIGDAVMAIFGVPHVHEDDALRAVRAGCEMRDALPELGVQARIGLNTGEVVTGTEERLATGDAVNVAARLEQAAQPGEILIGEASYALVREVVEVEALEPLELKGKTEPVPAFRLVAVGEEATRRHDVAMVGRARELQALRNAFARAEDDRSCQLFTVLGTAGVGKSRLAYEFLNDIDAQVVRGRCLSYGEGITYWPVVEALNQLDALPSDPAAAASLRTLLRETKESTSAEEIAWAFRKLLEEQAQATPLVCVFDDIHWGEETFLDLVDHVALLSTGAPILVLCLARPELAERRPEWPVALRLEPLPEAEVHALIPGSVTDELRAKITHASGGNPLFVTEMVVMAVESEGDVAVPPTLQALLAARLDQLEDSERFVLERGAVEGEIFHRGAVQALSDGRPVTPRLAALVRKGLIRPDTAQLPGEDAFRFRHLLFRDVAYNSLPKAKRAELHERFAVWLDKRADELVELDEIVGYHLEQAARYKAELGQPGAGLNERAGDRLAAAGRRANSRGDRRTAAALFERALEMTRPRRLDVHLELDLADVQQTWRRRAAVAEQTAEQARASNDEAGEALALVLAAHARSHFEDDPSIDELERLAHVALPLLEHAEDHVGLAWVWFLLGDGVFKIRGHCEEWAQAAEQALRHTQLTGNPSVTSGGLPIALLLGPRPANEALDTLEAVLPEQPNPSTVLIQAQLLAMLGRFGEAWALALPAAEQFRELRGNAIGENHLAEIAALAGEHASAVDHLRRWCDLLQSQGDRALLSTYAPQLGRMLCALHRYDEAEPLAQLGGELGSEQDFATQMLWRQVQARVDAHRGEHASAERLARDAVAIGAQTDTLNLQGDALCDLAQVLAAADRPAEAATALEQALERYERKKNLAMLAQMRPKLEGLRKAAPA
jgi:class 3 adenylate cyclase/tetratricopeptide (TPR) repeat protein